MRRTLWHPSSGSYPRRCRTAQCQANEFAPTQRGTAFRNDQRTRRAASPAARYGALARCRSGSPPFACHTAGGLPGRPCASSQTTCCGRGLPTIPRPVAGVTPKRRAFFCRGEFIRLAHHPQAIQSLRRTLWHPSSGSYPRRCRTAQCQANEFAPTQRGTAFRNDQRTRRAASPAARYGALARCRSGSPPFACHTAGGLPGRPCASSQTTCCGRGLPTIPRPVAGVTPKRRAFFCRGEFIRLAHHPQAIQSLRRTLWHPSSGSYPVVAGQLSARRMNSPLPEWRSSCRPRIADKSAFTKSQPPQSPGQMYLVGRIYFAIARPIRQRIRCDERLLNTYSAQRPWHGIKGAVLIGQPAVCLSHR